MRDVLFRAKRLGDGRWQEGYYIHLHHTTYCCDPDNNDGEGNQIHRIVYEEMTDWSLPNNHRMADVDPDTVGQWTGLCDKNGKRIYEGDILAYGDKKLLVWWNDESFQWQAKERQEATCSFDGMGVVWDNIDFGWLGAEYAYDGAVGYEVVGNRWDNPELFRQGGEKNDTFHF